MMQSQNIEESGDNYQIKISLHPQLLNIKLSTPSKIFSIQLNNYNIPNSIKEVFKTIEIIFEIFKYKLNYEVYPLEGKIKLKNIFNPSERKKSFLLQLEQKFFPSKERLQIEVEQMRNKIQRIERRQSELKQKVIEKEIKIDKLEKQSEAIIEKLNQLIQTINKQERKITEMEVSLQKKEEEKEKLVRKVNEIEKTVQHTLQHTADGSSKKATHPTINLESPFASKFKVIGNNIIYQGQTKEDTQLLMKNVIPVNKVFRFCCKILNTKQRQIIIGIVDIEKQLPHRYSWYSGNAICYRGIGRIYYGTPKLAYRDCGIGFYEGEKVCVEVDLSRGQVRWIVDGKQRATLVTVMAMEKNRKFVPYIEMSEPGDTVEWLIE